MAHDTCPRYMSYDIWHTGTWHVTHVTHASHVLHVTHVTRGTRHAARGTRHAARCTRHIRRQNDSCMWIVSKNPVLRIVTRCIINSLCTFFVVHCLLYLYGSNLYLLDCFWASYASQMNICDQLLELGFTLIDTQKIFSSICKVSGQHVRSNFKGNWAIYSFALKSDGGEEDVSS